MGVSVADTDEVVAGTDPFDPASFLRALGMAPSETLPGTFEFRFTSEPGLRYGIEASADLQSWSPLPGTITASGPVTVGGL